MKWVPDFSKATLDKITLLDDDFDEEVKQGLISATMNGIELPFKGEVKGDRIVFHVNTYKFYKFYVDGEELAVVTSLAEHEKAEVDTGRDEDGDSYIQVSFKLSDFAEVTKEGGE